MHRLLLSIEGSSRNDADCALSAFGDAPDVTPSDLHEALGLVPKLVALHPGTFEVSTGREKVSGHDYESLIWTLGESFRRIMKRQRRFRSDDALFEAIEGVCLDRGYGKGRESFTMLLGQYGGRRRVPVLLRLLEDPEICGHALYALRLLGAPEGVAWARKFLSSEKTWIRREAKQYLEKVARGNDQLVVT